MGHEGPSIQQPPRFEERLEVDLDHPRAERGDRFDGGVEGPTGRSVTEEVASPDGRDTDRVARDCERDGFLWSARVATDVGHREAQLHVRATPRAGRDGVELPPERDGQLPRCCGEDVHGSLDPHARAADLLGGGEGPGACLLHRLHRALALPARRGITVRRSRPP